MNKLKRIQKKINETYGKENIKENLLNPFYGALYIKLNNGKKMALYKENYGDLIKIFLDGNNILFFEDVSSVMDYLKNNLFGGV